MAWKINKIVIENFKYFLKPFTLEPKGKHVLMYGENGSGKSSIYWAVYTHFQSCLKDPVEAGKYFNKNHSDSLVNLFDTQNKRSGIEIEFVDPNGITKGYTDGSWGINTNVDDFIRLSTFASDFMNYKFLAAIFDFKNSKPVDLFKIFEDEVFPFLPLGAPRYDLDGTVTAETSVEQWWRYIKHCCEAPDVLTRRAPGSNVYSHDEKWQAYQNLISDFNTRLQTLLTSIASDANSKLEAQKMPMRVTLTLKRAEFDKKVEGTMRSYDGTFYEPQIILTARLLDSDGNPVSANDIKHPRSFFNEAKLTRMALALRLAVFDRKLQSEDCAKVIFVDDLLISLDMSNRLMVVQQLLDYSDQYQLFIFTHDRTFYDLIYDSISQRNMSKQWCYFELYAIDEEVSKGKVPEPWMNDKENFLQQARSFFTRYEYHASANSLRKECEKQLLRLYPHNWTLSKNNDGTVSIINLNGLIQKLKDFYLRFGIDPVPTPNIDQYRKRILNPASHNDSKAKVFRSELIMAIDEIEEFESIKKLMVVGPDDVSVREFVLEIDDLGHHIIIEFKILETWSKLLYNGQEYYEAVNVQHTSHTGMGLKNKEMTIRSIWNRVCRYMGYADDAYPKMEAHIRVKNSGVLLQDLPEV